MEKIKIENFYISISNRIHKNIIDLENKEIKTRNLSPKEPFAYYLFNGTYDDGLGNHHITNYTTTLLTNRNGL